MNRVVLAARARKHGAKKALRIRKEAKRAGIPVSLGFALCQKESNFTNVFGHDPTIFAGAGKVTKAKYLAYKRERGSGGRGGMQGVGFTQLTWYSYQDAADKIGGCWRPRYQIRVAFEHLKELLDGRSYHAALAAYNGSGPAADAYADDLQVLARVWRIWLYG